MIRPNPRFHGNSGTTFYNSSSYRAQVFSHKTVQYVGTGQLESIMGQLPVTDVRDSSEEVFVRSTHIAVDSPETALWTRIRETSAGSVDSENASRLA